MLEILKRSRFFFVGGRGGGRGGLYVLPKNVAVFALQNYMIYLLQLFSPPSSFAILYVLQKSPLQLSFALHVFASHTILL